MKSAASSSPEPPISPNMTTAFVSGSASNKDKQSMKLVPGTGSPPIPTHVVTPMPFWARSFSAWYVSVPGPGGGHAHHRRGRAGLAHGVGHRREHRNAFDVGTGLLRAHPSDDQRSVRAVAQAVEPALAARDALHDHPRVGVHQDAHARA